LIRRQLLKSDIQDVLNIRHLDEIERPTRRAKKCVDVKLAPHAKHTASRISKLHTRPGRLNPEACQSIFPETDKG
jgi:hypothetical protein